MFNYEKSIPSPHHFAAARVLSAAVHEFDVELDKRTRAAWREFEMACAELPQDKRAYEAGWKTAYQRRADRTSEAYEHHDLQCADAFATFRESVS